MSATVDDAEPLDWSWRWALKIAAGLALLFASVALLARLYSHELQAIGRGFVERFGYAGMAAGTFIADGFHFPVPPQFYMLVAVVSGEPQAWPAFAICAGSLLGGTAGYLLSRRLSHVAWIARWMGRSTRLTERLFARFGYRAIVIAMLLPVAYSSLCYVAGLCRLPRRAFLLLSLLRLPRLAFFYALIRLGWSSAGLN